MSRLRYSAQGFVKAMQVTRNTLQVFVEGKSIDSYVYGLVLDDYCDGKGGFRIVRSDEIPGSKRSGKGGLLDAYDWLRRNRKLAPSFKGIKHSTLFILDKDIDDVLGTRKRSPHVIYTPTYDVEGLVYQHGDLISAISACCSVAPSTVRGFMPDPSSWERKVMVYWKEWVRLCVLAQRVKAHGVCNFGVASQVNVQ